MVVIAVVIMVVMVIYLGGRRWDFYEYDRVSPIGTTNRTDSELQRALHIEGPAATAGLHP